MPNIWDDIPFLGGITVSLTQIPALRSARAAAAKALARRFATLKKAEIWMSASLYPYDRKKPPQIINNMNNYGKWYLVSFRFYWGGMSFPGRKTPKKRRRRPLGRRPRRFLISWTYLANL